MADVVVPHDPAWENAAALEADALRSASRDALIAVHHIGSTAIAGILAKPIIDLLGVTTDLAKVDEANIHFERMGYEAMGPFGIEGRRYFRKADGSGRRTHHLHVFKDGSPHIERHLAFRDYLRHRPDRAAAYSALKASLLVGEPEAPDYQSGKAEFVSKMEAEALAWHRGQAAARP